MSNLVPCDVALAEGGRYRARLAAGPQDLRRAQRLRHHAFIEAAGLPPRPGYLDRDRFDPLCRHLLIEERASGALAGCLRLRRFESGAGLAASYAAQHYDLTRLSRRPGRMAELGRFCLRPGLGDPQAIRLAWAALTRLVDSEGIGFLFGCASFPGNDPAPHVAALARLREAWLAPLSWRPAERAGAVDLVRFDAIPASATHAALPNDPPLSPPAAAGVLLTDPKPVAELADATPAARRLPAALHPDTGLPPLLRSYLAMGGRVSDHAVRDRELNTLHVFVGLETASVPASRVRALRELAGQGHGS